MIAGTQALPRTQAGVLPSQPVERKVALRLLCAMVFLLALSGTPQPDAVRMSGAILQASNEARVANGLGRLVVDERLQRVARAYARELAAENLLSHSGADGSTIVDRAQAAGYTKWSFLGENLARAPSWTAPRALVGGWLASDGHRENLLSIEATETGVGCAAPAGGQRVWCVQLFGSRGN